ncbi:hypothetical protein ACQUW5_05835 [Legionella sp. CNM-1927-20]|uniref:hypothetical protein n=1 Tax=Legionella sp. CNM-1927-20 TaxID=3422221 RepID=UPI00403B1CD2
MPDFKVVASDKHGNFFLKFPPPPVVNNISSKIDFYGQPLTQLQAFRFYGNLPDNNILNNKLINILGKNLLRLEKQKLERGNNPKKSQEQREDDVEFYARMERESNAFTISVLDVLSELEQTRSNSKDQLRINVVSTDLTEKIRQLYEKRIARIEKEVTDWELSSTSGAFARQIKLNRLKQLQARIEQNRDDILEKLREPEKRLQSLYRNIMDDFAHEQRDISVYQHTADRALDYANQSLTEAYQDAAYAMESHIFSPVRPSNEQLWQNLDNNEVFVLDSRDFPGMKKEDALLSAALIDYTVKPSKENKPLALIKKRRQEIKAQSKKVKELQNQQSSQPTKEQKTEAPNKNGVRPVNEILIEFEKNNQVHSEEISVEQNPLEALQKEDAGFCQGKDKKVLSKLQNPGQVKLYNSSDLFSAIGLACVDFGKYFEHQMASKHPAMTGAFFVAASATFGAAGLGAAGSHYMLAGLHYITKALTINGKLGVSPAELDSAIKAISAEWLKLTHSEGLIETLIMDGFGLPKINYVIFDTIINEFEHKDTLYQLARRFAQQDLEHYTGQEQVEKIAIQTAQVAAMFAAAIVFGVGVYKLAHLVGHGLGVEIAKDSASAVGKIINVPTEVFTDLFVHQSVVNEILAVASAVLTIKTAGLFLGKGLLLLNHLKQEKLLEITPDEDEAAILMIKLKDLFETDSDSYQALRATITDDELRFYGFHFKSLMAKSDEVAAFFGDNFLQAMGITKPPVSRIKIVGNKLKAFMVDGVWDKVVKPLAIIIGVPLTLFLVPLLVKDSRRPIANAYINAGLGIIKIVMMFGAALKTIFIAPYGTIQRLCMASSDALFNSVALFNYGFQKGRELVKTPVLGEVVGFVLGTGTLVAGGAAKILLAAASLTLKVLNFIGKVVKGIATVAAVLLSPVVGLFVTAGALLYFGAMKFKGEDITLKETLKSFWAKGVLGFIQGPSKIANWISSKLTEPLFNKMASASAAIDNKTRSVIGAPEIYKAKDKVTIKIGSLFDRGKEVVGNILYQIKNQTIRRLEQYLQKINKEEVQKVEVQEVDVQSAVLPKKSTKLHQLLAVKGIAYQVTTEKNSSGNNKESAEPRKQPGPPNEVEQYPPGTRYLSS